VLRLAVYIFNVIAVNSYIFTTLLGLTNYSPALRTAPSFHHADHQDINCYKNINLKETKLLSSHNLYARCNTTYISIKALELIKNS